MIFSDDIGIEKLICCGYLFDFLFFSFYLIG